MTPHHMPQNAILKRLKTWLRTYLGRPPIEGFREHAENRLAGLGVKYTQVMGYKDNDGVSFQMERKRHGQTRTYGKLPVDLDIPQGEWSVRGKHAGDERIASFVAFSKEESRKDREDVEAIYSGKKGLPAVKKVAKAKAGVAKTARENATRWGGFLG